MAVKRDANHEEIRDAFHSLGWGWTDTWRLGRGFADAIALTPARWGEPRVAVLIEVKDGYGKLTEAELKFHREYQGPLAIVHSPEEVRDVMAEYRDLLMKRRIDG